MYDIYGVLAGSYAEACVIAGCDGPDHDFAAEDAYYDG